MTTEQLHTEQIRLKREYEKALKDVAKKYCDANNPYKVGDVFTDHIGSIIIERIEYHTSLGSYYCCVYYGTILNKDGTPTKKKGNKRFAYQSNDITTK